MKSIFNKSAIALAILGLAGSASAGTTTGIFGGIEALDFQARNGDMDYATFFPTVSGGEVFTENLKPSFSWDFRAYAGLSFCGNDDLTVGWTHFHTSQTSYLDNPAVGQDAYVRWMDMSTTWTDIGASSNYNLDEVTGVFGHTVNLMAWSFRFAGGVEWAKLDTNFEDFATSGGDAFGYNAVSNLHGFGPRVEIDMTYHMPWGFGAFARTNAALLVSSRHVNLESLNDTILTGFDFSNRHVVVPKLGVRLGLNFTHGWGDVGGEGAAGVPTYVTLEAGWQAESYVHAVERPEGFGNTDGLTATGLFSNMSTKTSNYGDEGLFLGIKLATSWI